MFNTLFGAKQIFFISTVPLENTPHRFFIEDALRGRTTARPPLVNSHAFDSQPSCLASGDKHPWRTLEIGKDLA